MHLYYSNPETDWKWWPNGHARDACWHWSKYIKHRVFECTLRALQVNFPVYFYGSHVSHAEKIASTWFSSLPLCEPCTELRAMRGRCEVKRCCSMSIKLPVCFSSKNYTTHNARSPGCLVTTAILMIVHDKQLSTSVAVFSTRSCSD